MSVGYWTNFAIFFALGIILVLISHGKFLGGVKLNLSPDFFKFIRYIGLFIIVYNCYSVIIDYAIPS
jgi:hypothetical protein